MVVNTHGCGILIDPERIYTSRREGGRSGKTWTLREQATSAPQEIGLLYRRLLNNHDVIEWVGFESVDGCPSTDGPHTTTLSAVLVMFGPGALR